MIRIFRSLILILCFTFGALGSSRLSFAQSHRATPPQPGPWLAEVSTALSRGLDTYDHFRTDIGVKLSGKFANYHISLEGDFFNQWQRYEDPHIRGMEDVKLGFMRPLALSEEESQVQDSAPQLSWIGALSLPTSDTSQAATQIFSVDSGLLVVWPLRRLTISHGHLLHAFSHKFDTADVSGFRPNPQGAISNFVQLEVPLPLRLRLSVSGQYFSFWTYEHLQHDIQSLRAQIGGQSSDHLFVYARIATKSQRVSNLSLFDDDNTQISLGGNYVF